MKRKTNRSQSASTAEYIFVLLFYVAIYAFYYFMQARSGGLPIAAKDVPLMLLQNIGLNLLLFVGIAVLLMAIFNRGRLVSLTVHEQTVIDSVIWIAVVVLILIVVNNGIHAVFSAAGAAQPESPIIVALKSYFGNPWTVLIVGVPVMFLAAGLPEELMRCYAINCGIRLQSGFLSIFAVILTTIAFSFGHVYQGTEAMVSIAAVGLILAIVYYIRQSFWTQVFIHTVYNTVVLIIPLLTGKPPA
jgi:membrane protease YdiL (CAAX protease family)